MDEIWLRALFSIPSPKERAPFLKASRGEAVSPFAKLSIISPPGLKRWEPAVAPTFFSIGKAFLKSPDKKDPTPCPPIAPGGITVLPVYTEIPYPLCAQ